MYVKFWGVRGSIPTPGMKTAKIGGNTSCIEITHNDTILIIDAGSGVRELGNDLLKRGKSPIEANILFTHTHWDHIQGLPFFVPGLIPGNKFNIYGPVNYAESLKNIISNQMVYTYFPIRIEAMKSIMNYHELKECEFKIDDIKLSTLYLNHTILNLGYRIEVDNKVIVTAFDTEPYYNVFSDKKENEDSVFDNFEDFDENPTEIIKEMNNKLVNFTRDADILIYDSQYTKEEYETRKGWGHSTFEDAMEIAHNANVKNLIFFHHDPVHDDEFLFKKLKEYRKFIKTKKWKLKINLAIEGEMYDLSK